MDARFQIWRGTGGSGRFEEYKTEVAEGWLYWMRY